jgi:phosphoribosylamine--glycine ligase
VPTAAGRTFTDIREALAHVRSAGVPVVVKADGLAAGKGVCVCATVPDAEDAVRRMMAERVFGDAGARILVEERLAGEEVSILALVDGSNFVMLASAQDHKRAFDGDRGPNTGGMGAYSPAPVVTDALWPWIRDEVFARVLTGLKSRGIAYRGALYAGLMITPDGPKVLEFNCRFGDPETQAVLPRLDGDLVPLLEACVNGTLNDGMVRWRPEPCVCVVMAAGGYPDAYEKGKAIQGLEEVSALENTIVFHAGTRMEGGKIVTSGGRVLGVTALGEDMESAVSGAYLAVSRIRFDRAHYRADIAARALARGAG